MDYLFLILGIALFVLIKLNSAMGKEGFVLGYFIKKIWVNALMNLIAGMIIIMSGYFADKIKDYSTLSIFYAFLGSGGAMTLQALFDIFDKDKKTGLGIKKE